VCTALTKGRLAQRNNRTAAHVRQKILSSVHFPTQLTLALGAQLLNNLCCYSQKRNTRNNGDAKTNSRPVQQGQLRQGVDNGGLQQHRNEMSTAG
jgi:hypothetical protein